MVLFQIQSITEEKKRLKADLEEAYKRHKEELEIQQLQHFQVREGKGDGEGEVGNERGSGAKLFFYQEHSSMASGFYYGNGARKIACIGYCSPILQSQGL